MSALAELLRTPASIPGPASSPGIGLPRRTEIVDWSEAIDDLSRAAAEYRAAADKLECVADRHVQQLTAPGGSVWEGDAADAAVESSYADRGVVVPRS